MSYMHPAALAARRKYWTRHDAWRFAAPGTPEARMPGWLDPSATRVRLKEAQEEEARAVFEAELAELRASHERAKELLAEIKYELAWRKLCHKYGYNPSQPRVPGGNPDGGQWTRGGDGNAIRNPSGRNDPLVVSDFAPDGGAGAQYATRRSRGPVIVRIAGRTFRLEGGEAIRFSEAQSRADAAIARVRELDRNWSPTRSHVESVEGQITAYRAEVREAEARLAELAKVGIGPGPYAGESIPARGASRHFREAERAEINRIGYLTGCHTCGTQDPGTRSRNFVCDHQDPIGVNSSGRPMRIYPQCLGCSDAQGGHVLNLLRIR